MPAAAAGIRLQRSAGRAGAGFVALGGRTRLDQLHQAGSAKVMLPRVAGPVPEAVFLNTSGGLTDGDDLAWDLRLGPGARVTATTQTAERAYATRGGAAQARFDARLSPGARLDWLPQETILYEDSHLTRATTIDLAGDACCLLTESVILGRHAMGEAPCRARLTDRRLIRRDGRPFWAESLCITPAWLAQAAGPALLGDARAWAVIALVAPGAQDALAPLRAVLDEPGTTAAASGWDGRLIARIIARDGWPLRRQLARALTILRGAPPPRVWQMQGAL